jgi:hypothetical protein
MHESQYLRVPGHLIENLGGGLFLLEVQGETMTAWHHRPGEVKLMFDLAERGVFYGPHGILWYCHLDSESTMYIAMPAENCMPCGGAFA